MATSRSASTSARDDPSLSDRSSSRNTSPDRRPLDFLALDRLLDDGLRERDHGRGVGAMQADERGLVLRHSH
jgi:hypothetical protein